MDTVRECKVTVTQVTLFKVFVNRMSLTPGAAALHNDFCLVCAARVAQGREGAQTEE